jgi:hypothetical protein
MAPSDLELVEESGSSLLSHVACRSGFPHVAMAAVVMLLRLASERLGGSWSRLLSHGGLPSTSQRGDNFDSPDVHLQSELPGIIGPANQPPGTPTEEKKAPSPTESLRSQTAILLHVGSESELLRITSTARGQRPKVGLPAKVGLG